MTVRGPADLPELRDKLLEEWESIQRGLVSISREEADTIYRHSGLGLGDDPIYSWDRAALSKAALWWISAEMCELIYAMMPKVPADTLIDNLTIPSPHGLAVLEKPWMALDSDDADRELQVDAVVWGITMVESAKGRHDIGLAGSLSCYGRVDTDRLPDFWAPLGRSDWPVGKPLSEPIERPSQFDPAAFAASTIEDRRFLAALCTLLATPRIAEVTERPAPRPVRRRAERAGRPVPSPVRVVVLRRPEGERPEPEGERHVHWTHRWVVGAHLVNQPYGPGRKDRKLIVRGPFVKGPADKPLVVKTTVKAWVR